MKKIFQYTILAVAVIAMSSCASDIDDIASAASQSDIQLVVGDFPTFGNSQTRTIGNKDDGKTSWEDGDELLLEVNSHTLGAKYATFTYNDRKWELTSGELAYKEDEVPTFPHVYYAPNYKWESGNLTLKEGKVAGTDEYIEGTAVITPNGKAVDVSFSNATRNYSRLRIATNSGKDVTVITKYFTPANTTASVNNTYTLTPDAKGNAYLYGKFVKYSSVAVKYDDVTLEDYLFKKDTEANKSYALDATAVSLINMSTEEIQNTIKKELEDNNTNIRLILSDDMTNDDVNAIKSALGSAKDDNINLTIMGLKKVWIYALAEIPHVKSLKLTDAEEIGEHAIYGNTALQVFEAPKLKAIHSGAFIDCRNLQTLRFGPIEYAEEFNSQIFDPGTENKIDLILSSDQKELTEDPSGSQWKASGIPYADSSAHNNRHFINNYFKSITCGRSTH